MVAILTATASMDGSSQTRTHAPATNQIATPNTMGLSQTQQLSARQDPVFIENKGQWNQQAKFLLRGVGLDLWITDHGVVYDLYHIDRSSRHETLTPFDRIINRMETSCADQSLHSSISLHFLGADPAAAASAGQHAPGYHNYFIGNDSLRWVRDVPLYHQTHITNLYPGIDAVFYLDNAQPRYDLIVAAGADPARIRMGLEGAGTVYVDGDGSLVMGTPLGEIRQRGLLAYQIYNGKRRRVRCRFRVENDGSVGFDIGHYDQRRSLVIDPMVIRYSTLIGGLNDDIAHGIAVDSSGNAYIAGRTSSPDFPTVHAMQPSRAGAMQAFITKLTDSGTFAYSTYLGGSGSDEGYGLVIDHIGNIIILGDGTSTDFPILNAAQPALKGKSDVFVAKLDHAGALVYATYLGGEGSELGHGIATDSSGAAYITGLTGSLTFPTLHALQGHLAGYDDVFVTKLTANGTLVYSTYLGGSRDDAGYCIAADGQGNAYISGVTVSENFPLRFPAQSKYGGVIFDAFVTKITSDGSLAYSTYLGGSDDDVGFGITTDSKGNAYVTGTTKSTNFPTLNPKQPQFGGGVYEAFLTRLTPQGKIAYSSYLGGAGVDAGEAIVMVGSDHIDLVGSTTSVDFPTLNPFQLSKSGGYDAFILRMTTDGLLTHSTYLGGSNNDFPYGIAVDKRGDAYIVCETSSKDLPMVNAVQPSFGGGNYDVFIVKLAFDGNADVSPGNGAILADTDPTMLQLNPVTPNPATGDIHVTFMLPHAMAIAIEVYASDAQRAMAPIDEATMDAGIQSKNISVAGLPIGTYTLRLIGEGISRMQRFVVMR
ncbi:MAG: SBBP repeat-containing protein [Bacteroidota bacterium]